MSRRSALFLSLSVFLDSVRLPENFFVNWAQWYILSDYILKFLWFWFFPDQMRHVLQLVTNRALFEIDYSAFNKFLCSLIFVILLIFVLVGSKTCLNLAISRIKLLRNKREVQLKQMKKEIAQYIQTGQEAIARIRVC